MSRVHLVTGATGFVGGALVLELLARSDDELVCLVRCGNDAVQGQKRLLKSLREAAVGYDRLDLLPEIERRCRAAAGDITLPDCGGHIADLRGLSQVWHCAASLNYEEENEAQIQLHNVAGTRNVLDVARRLGGSVFNYVSTAYVAGSLSGTILEQPVADGVTTNNRYEQSKIAAERLVARSGPFHVRILRPSIVIGHRRTFVATSFTGLYGFMRELHWFKRQVSRRLGDFLRIRPMRLRAQADVPLNLIPIDAVAANAVGIGLSNSSHMFFHLTNDAPVEVERGLRLLFSLMELRTPRFGRSPLEFTTLDEVLDRELEFYNSYVAHPKTFDRSHTDAVLGCEASTCPLPDDRLRLVLQWYLELLEARAAGTADQWAPPAEPSTQQCESRA